MSIYFEVAYAAESRRLCLFTGTGFSKAVTKNKAPSWRGLLEDACTALPNGAQLRTALLPPGAAPPLPLEEAAQVLDIEFRRNGLSLHEQIASSINALKLLGNNSDITRFLESSGASVITTNYDKLIEGLAGKANVQSISPGLPIPRSTADVLVYHIHGSVDVPSEMVVTSNDYFRFLNSESYFFRKLSTLLHENTVVILGYSLSDTNLKTILSDYRAFTRHHSISGSIILISRDSVDQHIKDYYAFSFGIRVVDATEIHEFFRGVLAALPEAQKSAATSKLDIRKVLYSKHKYLDNYLRLPASFVEIVAAISAIGVRLTDPAVVTLFGEVIERKKRFTNENGAWEQYGHLAAWLVHLGSLIDIDDTSLEPAFLTAAQRSMETMSSTGRVGLSWQAYREWSGGWERLLPGNRALVRRHVEASSHWPDALQVVARL